MPTFPLIAPRHGFPDHTFPDGLFPFAGIGTPIPPPPPPPPLPPFLGPPSATPVVTTYDILQRQLDSAQNSRWRGPTLPFTPTPKGYFESRGTRSVILSSIMNILNTPLDSRIMMPQFGSVLHELVFEPNDDILGALAQSYVADAIARWEPRVRLNSSEIFRDQFRSDVLNIRLTYTILDGGFREQVTLRLSPPGTPVGVEVA